MNAKFFQEPASTHGADDSAQMRLYFEDSRQPKNPTQNLIVGVKDNFNGLDTNVSQYITYLIEPLRLLHKTFLNPNRFVKQAARLV